MSLNISLYTISAVLILDNEGNRLFAKYYKSSLGEDSANPSSKFLINLTLNNNNLILKNHYFPKPTR